MIAALYIEPDGVYSGIAGVDAWCEMRDARCYSGPYPVVAHPPCQRWGRFWHGSTRKPHQFKLGDDGGCFATASIHYKCCDDGDYELLDADCNVVKAIEGYVPSIMCPEGEGYGDYVIMEIAADGSIAKWKADLSDFEKDDEE